ncbi:uncharacterized protein [Magallana gigas]|uniref:Uncharacterized protein n=1 Tax=Magallana gigas TaxID=29159 RepID=A0A8W8N0B3_MAGGI|nr:uncharacterized protein LOC105328517 [Crassostrea gigas]|eukprot:XP_011427732.1 PREDICTED: uncharacterized protein LOC105328517 [Crassostrea gigas]
MSKETGGAKKYGPANNPYEFTMRNYLAYLKPARRAELKFNASYYNGVTFMLAASFLLLGGLYPMLRLHDRINFVEKAYHGHYRVLRREDADPKLKELGYYN